MQVSKQENQAFKLLYNQETYHQLMGSKQYKCFQFKHSRWAFSLVSHSAMAPFRGTFAGPEYEPSITINELITDFEQVIIELQKEKIKQIKLKLGSNAYYHLNQEFHSYLMIHFKIKPTSLPEEHAYIIPIGHQVEDFLNKLSTSKQREYRNAMLKKHTFQILSSPTSILWFYEKVKESRELKSRPFTQDFQSFENSFLHLADNYKVALVKNKEDEILAFSVIVQIHPKSIYTLYTVTLPAHKKENVQSFLHAGIYKEALKQNLSFIDLGTSTADGIINQGLAHFKKSLGGQMLPRYGFEMFL